MPPMLILLGVFAFINYVDRSNISIAAPALKDELGLTVTQVGILLSAFFWSYASCQIIAGWLVDRFNVYWVVAVGFFVWSSATALTGAVHGFALLLAMRLIIGVGESVAYPSYSKILAGNFPEHQRGTANSVISAGMAGGPAFGTLAGGLLMATFGWRPFFVVLGLGSLLWLVPWFGFMPRTTSGARANSAATPDIREIVCHRSAWGCFVGQFCSNYLWYFLLTWVPFYLVHERHFSLSDMARIGGLAYLSVAVAALVSGHLSDRWIGAGRTATRVRKLIMLVGQTGAAISLVLCVVAGPGSFVVFLIVACAAYGVTAPMTWAFAQTLAGPATAGRWTGLQNTVGNLAGVIAPALTGFVVDRTGRFFWAFAITAGVALLGVVAWVGIVGQLREVTWARRPALLVNEISLDPA